MEYEDQKKDDGMPINEQPESSPADREPVEVASTRDIVGDQILEPASPAEAEQIPTHAILLPSQIIEMIKKGQKIPKEVLEKQQRLQEFTLAFIKSILRTSYYEADHPEAKSSKAGLFENFQMLMEGQRELTFLFRKGVEDRDVLLDGYLDEATTLTQIMSKNMADIFIPKFMDYFDRRALRSISIKTSITKNEFDRFIDIVGETPMGHAHMTLEEERNAMIKALETNRILSISTIFEEDIIGQRRRLPWRVELAISRLCKDLTILPLYRMSSLETLQRIKMQIFEDIFRPIRRGDVLCEVMINADLIRQSVANLPELSSMDVELTIIQILPHRILVSTANFMGALYRQLYINPRAMFGIEPDSLRTTVKDLLVKFAHHILDERPPEGDVFLEALYHDGIMVFGELPDHVQDRITVAQLTDFVQSNVDESCDSILKAVDDASYGKEIDQHQKILPELLRRGDLRTFIRVYSIFEEHRTVPTAWFRARSQMAQKLLDGLWNEHSLGLLGAFLLSAEKEDRNQIVTILSAQGVNGVPHLFIALEDSPDKWMRKHLLDTLVQLGPSITPFLLIKLQAKDLPWYIYRNVLYLLNQVRAKESVQLAQGFIQHPTPQVQVEAVKLLYALAPEDSRIVLLSALKTEHFSVRRKVVDVLSRLKVMDQTFTSLLRQWLLEDTTENNELLQVSICHAIGRMGNFTMPNMETSETLLHRAIVKEEQSGFLAVLRPLHFLRTPPIQTAAAYALGQIGTKKSKRVLSQLSQSKHSMVQDSAKIALEKLNKRL